MTVVFYVYFASLGKIKYEAEKYYLRALLYKPRKKFEFILACNSKKIKMVFIRRDKKCSSGSDTGRARGPPCCAETAPGQEAAEPKSEHFSSLVFRIIFTE